LKRFMLTTTNHLCNANSTVQEIINSVQKLYTEQKLVMLLFIMDNQVCHIDE
jgi:hypothetical protein